MKGQAADCTVTGKYVNYSDGKKIMIGDRLKLWDGCFGTVVCSIDDGEYTPEHSRDHWAYLKSGVLINSTKTGLIHFTATLHCPSRIF
jgi:hypothetical protein